MGATWQQSKQEHVCSREGFESRSFTCVLPYFFWQMQSLAKENKLFVGSLPPDITKEDFLRERNPEP